MHNDKQRKPKSRGYEISTYMHMCARTHMHTAHTLILLFNSQDISEKTKLKVPRKDQ